jgi:hypothetical protein
MSQKITYEAFIELLGKLPPEEQEEVLLKASERIGYLMKLEGLKSIKATVGKYIVVMPWDENMDDWDAQEHDSIDSARYARALLIQQHPNKRPIVIIDEAGNRLDEDD